MSLVMHRKPVKVLLDLGEHIKAGGQEVCHAKNHEGCDWETLVKKRLELLFPDMQVNMISPKGSPLVELEILFTNRPTTEEEDVLLRLDEYFRQTPLMTVKSVKIQ